MGRTTRCMCKKERAIIPGREEAEKLSRKARRRWREKAWVEVGERVGGWEIRRRSGWMYGQVTE